MLLIQVELWLPRLMELKQSQLQLKTQSVLYQVELLHLLQKAVANSVTVDAATPVTPPLETTASSTTVTLHEGSHGLAVGDTFTLFNTMPVASLDPSELNKEHTVVSVPNTDSVTFTTTTAAASTSIGGGSDSVVFLPVKATSAVLGGGSSAIIGLKTSVL